MRCGSELMGLVSISWFSNSVRVGSTVRHLVNNSIVRLQLLGLCSLVALIGSYTPPSVLTSYSISTHLATTRSYHRPRLRRDPMPRRFMLYMRRFLGFDPQLQGFAARGKVKAPVTDGKPESLATEERTRQYSSCRMSKGLQSLCSGHASSWSKQLCGNFWRLVEWWHGSKAADEFVHNSCGPKPMPTPAKPIQFSGIEKEREQALEKLAQLHRARES